MSEGRPNTDKGFVIRPLASEERLGSGWDDPTERARGP